ncbi:MAG: GNAT family N-acetyltransferase [Promethearchaeota archaeon]
MTKVRDFTPADAAGLAKCINESEGGWPGGISGGLDHTAEHILEDYKREAKLAWLIAVSDEQQIAGISTLHPHFDDPAAAYLGFLTVSDAYRKKGFGKALLVESVNRVIAEGYKRLFLHTWGGNLNAVPVYKRTGFFWCPETQVLMENYIPTIITLPIARPFFKKHDWYETYIRQIEIKPDEMKHRGLNVYEYRWEKGDEFLRVVIDRESRGPTLIENRQVLIECWVADAEPTLGLPIPVSWSIQNKNPNKPLTCHLKVKLPKGFQLIEAPASSIMVPAKETVVLEGIIRGSVNVIPPPKERPALAIVSQLLLEKRPVKLETGIRAQHPIELTTVPPSIWCRAGTRFSIPISIKSNLKKTATGRLIIRKPRGLQIDQKQFEIRLNPERHSGIELNVATKSSLGSIALPIKLQAQLDVGGQQLKTRTETIFVHNLSQGGVLVTPAQDDKRLQVHTETLQFSINLVKGAHIDKLTNRLTGRVQLRSHCRESIGPPFWPSEQMRTHFKHRIEKPNDGTTRIVTWMTSKRYSGLVFSKTYIITGNSSVLGIEYMFENTDPKKTYKIQLIVGSIPGAWDHLHVLPLKTGLLREEYIEEEFFASEREILKRREDWAETWYCAERPHKGEITAVLCPPSLFYEARGVTFIDFQLQIPPIPPKKKIILPPLYLVAGLGSWKHIRRLWHHYYSDEPERALLTRMEPNPAIDLRIKDNPMLHEVASEITIPLQLHHHVHRPLKGSLQFSAPKGWRVTPRTHKFEHVKDSKPLSVPIQLHANAKAKHEPQILSVTAHVKTDLQTREFNVPIILHRKTGKVSIIQAVEHNQKIWIIDNGKYLLKIAPSFAGSVFAWIKKETGTNYLVSNFPTAGPKVWFNPWYGGIQFEPFASDQPGWFPTKLDREKWTLTKSQRNDWQGIQVSVVPDKEERRLRDLKLGFHVLTQPQSNIVALIGQIQNQSKAPRQLYHRFRIAIPSDETTPKLETVIPRSTTTYWRNRVKTHAWPTAAYPYLGIEHGPDDATLIFTQNMNPMTELFMGDLNSELVFIQSEDPIDVSPNELVERTGFLVATQAPWEQAKTYSLLSKLSL